MHEYGIAHEIVEAVKKYVEGNKADRPIRCWVQMGAICGINPEALENAFPLAAENTICKDMEMDVFIEPAVCKCRDCNSEIKLKEYTDMIFCQSCGSVDIEYPDSARRIFLTKLELEKEGKVFILEFKNVEMEEEEHHHD